MRAAHSLTLVGIVLLVATGVGHAQAPGGQEKGATGQNTVPRKEARAPAGAPVETAPPNVPELKPAFPGQTRAPAVKTSTPLQVTEIASGFNKPWGVALLPDGRFLVTEKPTGHLYIVAPDGTKSPAVRGLPKVDGRDQGGLLDIQLAPDFEKSRQIYWSYYEPRPKGNGLAVARAKLIEGSKQARSAPRVENVEVIFRMQPTLDSTMHAGGRILFTPDGNLFAVLGERSILEGRRQARDLNSHFGKIVRIRPDGSVPKDNPFVGRKGALPEIWSLGHRNILAATLDEEDRLWVTEMGPRGGDELNQPQAGKDYGWPTIGYGEEYSGAPIHKTAQAPGLEQPVYYWDPVISPSGMVHYTGALVPEWRGNFLIGGLSSRALVRVVMKDGRVVGEERLLTDLGERIRDVVQDEKGALYLLTDHENGRLLKVTPAPSAQ